MVVHALVVDPDLREHPRRPVLRPARLHARLERSGHLLRQPHRHLRQLPDRARLRQLGHHPGHGGVRSDPALLFLAGDGRPARHAGDPALLEPRGLRERLQSRGRLAVRRHRERLPGDDRRRNQRRHDGRIVWHLRVHLDAAAPSVPCLLPALAGLGSHTLRRGPGRQGVPQGLLRDVLGALGDGRAGRRHHPADRQDGRLGLLLRRQHRVLPEWAANISAKRRVPYGSLILMIVPSLVVSAIWAYQPSFQGIFLWATGVIAITFLGTVVAAAILPWRRKDIFENSPISRFRVAGIPVITITGVVSAIFLVFMLAEWSFNSVYGTSFSLNSASPIYFGLTYLAAIVIYLVARTVRKRQGIDLSRIHREIPVE